MLADSQGDFFKIIIIILIGLSALGESFLPSSAKGRWPPGQMLCLARQGAKGAAPGPAKDGLHSRRMVAREEATAQATAMQELPGFPPFLSSGLLEPLEAESFFQALEEGPPHCIGWMSTSALPSLFRGPCGTGH